MNLSRFKQIEAERNESRERAIVRKEDPDVAEVRCRMRQERGDRASYHAHMVNALRAHEIAREAREEEEECATHWKCQACAHPHSRVFKSIEHGFFHKVQCEECCADTWVDVDGHVQEEESMEDPETTFVHRINVREEVTT